MDESFQDVVQLIHKAYVEEGLDEPADPDLAELAAEHEADEADVALIRRIARQEKWRYERRVNKRAWAKEVFEKSRQELKQVESIDITEEGRILILQKIRHFNILNDLVESQILEKVLSGYASLDLLIELRKQNLKEGGTLIQLLKELAKYLADEKDSLAKGTEDARGIIERYRHGALALATETGNEVVLNNLLGDEKAMETLFEKLDREAKAEKNPPNG